MSTLLRRLARHYADDRPPFTFTRYEMRDGHLVPVASGTIPR